MRPLFNRSKYTSKYNLGSGSGKSGEKASGQERSLQNLNHQPSGSADDFVTTPTTPDSPDNGDHEKGASEMGVLRDVEEVSEERV